MTDRGSGREKGELDLGSGRETGQPDRGSRRGMVVRVPAGLPDGRSLTGRTVRLDRAVPDDAAALFAALDDERVYRYGYGGGPAGRPSSPQPIAAAIRAASADPSRTMYIVRLLTDSPLGAAGSVAGTTTLGDAVPEHRRIHIGWTGYSPAVWGTTINPECKFLLLGLAFDGLGYGRVKIQTDLINERSQAAIARLGAVREGVLRHHQLRADGSWRDTVVFSILAEEWPGVRERLERRMGHWPAGSERSPGPAGSGPPPARKAAAEGSPPAGTEPRQLTASDSDAASSTARVLQGALRASIADRAVRVGRFLISFDEASDLSARNYAIPDDDAAPAAAEVAAMVAAFRARGRRPRLEIVVPAPGAQEALDRAGFVEERRLPLLVHDAGGGTRPTLAGPGSGDIAVALVTSDDELRLAAGIQHVAYGGEGDAQQSDVDRLARTVRAGGGVALGWLHGTPVGSGLFVPPLNGFAEVAAVGVLPRARRQGVAAAVALRLTEGVLTAGAQPFLQAEDTPTARIYQRIGYRIVGELAMVSLP